MRVLPKIRTNGACIEVVKHAFKDKLLHADRGLQEKKDAAMVNSLPVPTKRIIKTPVRTRRSGLTYEMDLSPLFLGLLNLTKRVTIFTYQSQTP